MLVICGLMSLSTHMVLTNQDAWDDLYNVLRDKTQDTSENDVYMRICRLHVAFSVLAISGLLMLSIGVILQAIGK